MKAGKKNRRYMILNKKGSYIVEAAVVFPVIMLAVITSVLIIMFFYIQMTEQCRLHKALRQEAGRVTEKTIYPSGAPNDTTDATIHIDNNALGGKVTGRKYLVMDHKGMLDKKGTFTLDGHCYAIDGAAYVRISSIIREKKNE